MSEFSCPHCNALLADDQLVAGQSYSCPSCQGQFLAPHPPAMATGGMVASGPARLTQPRQNFQYEQDVEQPSVKNAGLAAILSFFLVGLGQMYNGQIGKGLMFLICPPLAGGLIFVLLMAASGGAMKSAYVEPPTVNLPTGNYFVDEIPPSLEETLTPKSKQLLAELRDEYRLELEEADRRAAGNSAVVSGFALFVMFAVGIGMFALWIFGIYDAYQTAEKINCRGVRG